MILGHAFPGFQLLVEPFTLLLQLIVGSAQLRDGLLSKQLLQRPLLNVLRFVILELIDEGNRALENRPLVLLAVGHDFCELIDALVYRFATAALD